ncbi:DUF6082 family protein [Streptomyces sp. NPDC002516]
MPPLKPADALIEQMMRDASPENRAGGFHQAAAMIVDIGMRRDPTGADIDEVWRLLGVQSQTKMLWKSRGPRLGMSARRFLVDVSEVLGEARRGAASRGVVRHVGGWRRDQEDYVSRLVSMHDMRLGLLHEALSDPALAETLNVYEYDLTPEKHRQFLFVEAMYRTYLLEWRVKVVTMAELHGNLRILLQNRIFREYWEATRHHRANLVDESDEARIGRLVDQLIWDLDESDTEEWWTVGEPPTADGNF